MKLAPLTEETLAAAPLNATIITAFARSSNSVYYVTTAFRGEADAAPAIIVINCSDAQSLVRVKYTSLSSFTAEWGEDLSCSQTNSKEAV